MPCFTPSSLLSRHLPPADVEDPPVRKAIRIRVDEEVLGVLIDNEFQLCVAFQVNGVYNVVARMSGMYECLRNQTMLIVSSEPSESMHVHWEQTYVMQASNQPFRFRRVINGAGGLPLPIRPGQTYVVSDWKTQTVVEDSSLPKAKLGFQNDVMAAPVIYMTVGKEEPSPIYTTKILPPKHDSEYFCRAQVALWFDSKNEYQQYSIFDFQNVKRRAHEFDLTRTNEIEVLYTAEGDWKQHLMNGGFKRARNGTALPDSFHFELR